MEERKERRKRGKQKRNEGYITLAEPNEDSL